MRELSEEVLPKERRDELWLGIKSVNRMLLSEEEAEMVRDNVDAHKSSSFTEQIAAYKQCEYGNGVVSMFALMKIAWIIQETIGEVQENLRELEGQFYDLVRVRNKRWKELKKQLEERSFTE